MTYLGVQRWATEFSWTIPDDKYLVSRQVGRRAGGQAGGQAGRQAG